MMKTFSEYLDVVNRAIADKKFPEEPKRLYEPITYTMSLGGKRLRPVMMLMACDAFGGNSLCYINQAIGLEFFHNFTLLHDDLMDNADVRRGMPTVFRKWDSNTAILSGDAMLTVATQIVTDGIDGEKLGAVLKLFNRTAMEIYEGQQYDMDFEEQTDTTVEEYVNMIRLKTSVLFGCATRMGAICAGADKNAQQAIYDYAVNLGLAFQLQDDYLDVYGNEKTFGKQIGGDILNAKKTFMLISAYAKADNETRNELNALLALDNTTDAMRKVAGVTEIYNRLGIPALAKEQMEVYCHKALHNLNNISSLSDEAKAEFAELLNKLMNRDR